MKTYHSDIPSDSLIANALERIDYQDVYGLQLPIQSEDLLVKMPLAFFSTIPSWLRILFYIRESSAKWLGLKKAHEMDVLQQMENFRGEVGESIALFKVMGRSETEVLSGENDSHLDFRLSFFALPNAQGTELRLATTVQFNGTLGKLYFIPVGPIHRLITPYMLKRVGKALMESHESGTLSMATK
ncbi:MAG: DUF2867 domain-containing protein [Bacteroidota bacterium]